MLSKIHNNPKLEGPRMPLILPQELEGNWLYSIEDELDVKSMQELIREYPDKEIGCLHSETIKVIRIYWEGRGVFEPFEYAELKVL